MRLSLNELVPDSVSLENDKFDNIVECLDEVNISDREIEIEATLVHEIEIESRDESLEIVLGVYLTVPAEDLEYDGHEEYVHASRLRASSNYEIFEEDQYSEQELREIKKYVEEYLVGPNSASTYKIEADVRDGRNIVLEEPKFKVIMRTLQ